MSVVGQTPDTARLVGFGIGFGRHGVMIVFGEQEVQ